jgi:hypothetical protein
MWKSLVAENLKNNKQKGESGLFQRMDKRGLKFLL